MGKSDEKGDRKRDRSRSSSHERSDRKKSHKDSKRRRSRSRSESPSRRRRDERERDRSDRNKSYEKERYDRNRDSDRNREERYRDEDRHRDERGRDSRHRERDSRHSERERSRRSKSNDTEKRSPRHKSDNIEKSISSAVVKTAEELAAEIELKRAAEQAALDDEMKKRRDRVKAWQEAKAKRLAEEEALIGGGVGSAITMTSDGEQKCSNSGGIDNGNEEMETAEKHHGWSLEDDEEEDAAEVVQPLVVKGDDAAEAFETDLLPPPQLTPLKHLSAVSNLDRDIDDDEDDLESSASATAVSVFSRKSVGSGGVAVTSAKALSGSTVKINLNAVEIQPKKPILSRIKSATITPSKPVIITQPTPSALVPVPEEDFDPLDAFMTSLYGEGDVATQKELPSISSKSASNTGGGIVDNGPSRNIAHQVITLDQIMGSMRGASQDDEFGLDFNAASSSSNAMTASSDRKGWESDFGESGTSSPLHLHGGLRSNKDVDRDNDDDDDDEMETDETEAEREEREERERQEFVAAIRKAREEEDVIREKLMRLDEEAAARSANMLGRVFAGEGDMVDEAEISEKRKGALELLEEAKRGKMLKEVDHSKIDYIPFRKNLYIVPRAISKLTEAEIGDLREDLHIKVRGRGCPAPVSTWEQCGLSDRLLKAIQAHDLKEPFAIQKQAIPAIMCGRDVIGVAKTGSGKTLAFLLPMLRHILDQPPLGVGEGPIGLIMAPARELAGQIFSEAKKFAQPLGIRVACIYGGADVKEQIADLKRGADIVVCTPGRLIDILCMQAGKLVSLKRVTMVVLDEADRMFDMGFEPQIKMIVQNTRPDRQTVLFSATFPKQIEKLAKSALRLPLEIVVGERSTVNKDITQYVEVHEEDDKFLRLLQLLGIWYEKGSVLVFVDKQEKCDQLFQELLKLGYPCLSLHGGKDQVDREHTLHEFKTGIKTVMIATSVAGRGLDVPEIICVVNYNCPNHLEDYVHRVGRTGRAGRKGFAYTFISQKEEQYSPVMMKALEKTSQPIPVELAEMVAEFKGKVERGEAQWSSSGFVGKGYKFDASEMNESQKIASLQKRAYEMEQGLLGDDEDLGGGAEIGDDSGPTPSVASGESAVSTTAVPVISASMTPLERASALAAQLQAGLNRGNSLGMLQPSITGTVSGVPVVVDAATALAKAKLIAQQMGSGRLPSGLELQDGAEYFSEEVEINDYPPQARRKVTSRTSIEEITDRTGVAIISRGSYINVPPGKLPPPGERKLYLLIEGKELMSVRQAKMEILKVLEEETIRIGTSAITQPSGRYNVL